VAEDRGFGLKSWLAGPKPKQSRIETPPTGPISLDRRRVAVLPFVNMSPDPGEEYFSDGMTEELIQSLSGVSDLTVIARTSVMKYKASQKGVADVAKELDAGTLIEGSVRKSGSKLRITVQQIDARTQGHVWSQTYDRELNDVFAIQTEIAQRVSHELKVQLAGSERERLDKKPTNRIDAYVQYLKGRFYWNARNPEGYTKAISYYEQSIKRDPDFALGYSGLALCYNTMGRNHIGDLLTNFHFAKENASKALKLDPNLADAHAALAAILDNFEYDHSAAEAEFNRAIELRPSYATAHHWYSILLLEHRRFAEALREITTAIELDPLSLIINNALMDNLYYQGDLDGAINQFRKLIEMEPNFIPAHQSVIQIYIRKGLFDDALAEGALFSKLAGVPMYQRMVEASVHAAKGNIQESLRMLKEVGANYKFGDISPYMMALAHFTADDRGEGFEWLQTAVEAHDSWVNLMAIDFELERVRKDPRFLDLLKKVGLNDVRFA
jgi:adenylate cyclase